MYTWIPIVITHESLRKDTFKDRSRVHNWRNYIPEVIEDHWDELTAAEKQLLIYMAIIEAGKEEWE